MAAAAKTKTAKTGARESVILGKVRLLIGARHDVMAQRINTGVFRAMYSDHVVRSAQNGTPDILGTQLRCITRVAIVGEDRFQPFEKKNLFVYGQAFAIETKTDRGKLSDAQKKWRDAFETVGGLYIVARTEADVLKALGREPPTDVLATWWDAKENW